MTKMKLKVERIKHVNPSTKAMGYCTRVVTNSRMGFDEIAERASSNTTVHQAEMRMSLEICMETASEMLRQGYIVDLGPLGTLYPSCNSGWAERAEDLRLERLRPSLFYRPARGLQQAVGGASLQWLRGGTEEEE
jgi:hypothetical protein